MKMACVERMWRGNASHDSQSLIVGVEASRNSQSLIVGVLT